MSPQDSDFPWVFRRDEIDILEDELEDLYEKYHRPGDVPSFESSVLREQLDTEERSDQELSQRLGFDVLEPPPEEVVSSRDSDVPSDTWSAWQEELVHVRSHPLYQQAKKWATVVKPTAKRGYEQGGAYAGELFRIYANVNLVPLKIFTALCEELHEDEVGYEIAREEYHLALMYIDRILESMSLMIFTLELSSWMEFSREGARTLRDAVKATLANLPRPTPPV
ncbi:MAG: hypothetical protein AAB413_02375 [Patescibacteria group bacterium]